MKVIFTYSDPYQQVNKNFRYHGINTKCQKPADPSGFDDVEVPYSDEAYFVFTENAIVSESNIVQMFGEHQALGAGSYFILRGFLYGVKDEEEYKIVYEMGEFGTDHYNLSV